MNLLHRVFDLVSSCPACRAFLAHKLQQAQKMQLPCMVIYSSLRFLWCCPCLYIGWKKKEGLGKHAIIYKRNHERRNYGALTLCFLPIKENGREDAFKCVFS